jgi:hypothetical protein
MALTDSGADAIAVVREAEAIVVEALFDDVARALSATEVETAPDCEQPAAIDGGASYYTQARDDRTTVFFWARSPPLV